MISSRHKFIFLHVPKTAGNAVQSYLLPHSDDRKVIGQNQDGIERFGVRGALTREKHAMLQSYSDRLGPALGDYAVILPVRDPLDRALSLYFSPHQAFGRPDFVPVFEPQQFEQMLATMPAMVDFLRVGGIIRKPDFLLHFDSIGPDLAGIAMHFGLPQPALPTLNRSLDAGERRASLRRDPEVVGRVRERFAEDFAYFGF